jgi:ribosome-binding protein aMBF1 (putative translation factor)
MRDQHVGSTLTELLFGNDPKRLRELDEIRLNLDIGQAVYDIRKAAGLSREKLARRIGSSRSAIRRLEYGNYRGHSVSMLHRIAAACGHRVSIRFEPETAEAA